MPFVLIIIIITCLSCQRQGASADKLHVKAAKFLPLFVFIHHEIYGECQSDVDEAPSCLPSTVGNTYVHSIARCMLVGGASQVALRICLPRASPSLPLAIWALAFQKQAPKKSFRTIQARNVGTAETLFFTFCAGVKHMVALGRSGRLEGASSALTGMMSHGWAAAVTITKCDVAFTEDTRAVLAPDRRLGETPPCLVPHATASVYDRSQHPALTSSLIVPFSNCFMKALFLKCLAAGIRDARWQMLEVIAIHKCSLSTATSVSRFIFDYLIWLAQAPRWRVCFWRGVFFATPRWQSRPQQACAQYLHQRYYRFLFSFGFSFPFASLLQVSFLAYESATSKPD